MRFLARYCSAFAVSTVLLFAVWQSSEAQTIFRSGQSVQPVFEGWERNPDGTFTMWFGYMNRNYEEQPHVPVGENNFFSPGQADRGQPTHFYNRRQNFMFSTVVPADWGDQQLIWTMRHEGQDHKAVGWLFDVNWEIDEGVWRANRSTGIRGRGDAIEMVNKPPTVSILGSMAVTAYVDEPLTLTATASDDNNPGPEKPAARPPQAQPQQEGEKPLPIANFAPIRSEGPIQQQMVKYRLATPTGLAITWLHHRGPGMVKFEPQAKGVEPGKEFQTTVLFSEPGTHVIRAAADDTGFVRYADVTVEVRRR